MNMEYLISGIITVALLAYLTYALLKRRGSDPQSNFDDWE